MDISNLDHDEHQYGFARYEIRLNCGGSIDDDVFAAYESA